MRVRQKIAIVGGGPAGSTCAQRLSAAGLDVTLFEERPTGEKPCGGGVPSGALTDFPELMDPSLERRVVREVRIYSPSDRLTVVPTPAGIHMFRRAQLDDFLRRRAETAGSRLVRARVTSVRSLGKEGWELATTAGASGPFDRIVGADGVRSIVRRAVSRPYAPAQLTLALYAYVPGVTRTEMVLKFFPGLGGYLWAFPRTDHVSVGICARYRTIETGRLAELLHRFVERHYPEGHVACDTLKGYFIPADDTPPAATSGPDWALVGDAAGFVDPLTREGISWAMRSAVSLADRMVRQGIVATPRVPGHLLWAHRHGDGFYNESFLESMAGLSRVSPAIRNVLADLLTGRQGYRGLKRRLLMNALPGAIQIGFGALAGIARLGRNPGQG